MSLLVHQHDILSKEAFFELIAKAQAGDLAARNTIIEHNIRLVLKFALQAHKKFHSIEPEDLLQFGIFGLIRAIDKYDANKINQESGKPYSFSTYATWWIRQSIDREVAGTNHTIRYPVHAIKKMAQYKQILQYMIKANIPINDASVRAEMECLQLSETELKLFQQPPVYVTEVRHPSLPGYSEQGTQHIYDTLVDEGSDFASILEADDTYQQLLEMCKDCLTEVEYNVIQRRFGLNGYDPQTLDDIGIVVNLTRERIRQIQVKALSKLRLRFRIIHGENIC